jgi:hypothetical protein
MRTTKFGSLTIDGLWANVSKETRCALNTSSVIKDGFVILPQSESWASPRRKEASFSRNGDCGIEFPVPDSWSSSLVVRCWFW